MSKEIDLRRKSVLIVECDSIKLANQSLSVGSDIFRILKLLFRNNPIEIVQTTTEVKLLDTIRKLTETKRKFRNIIIIGHSNQNGLTICSDRNVNWTGVANWLNKFEPHNIYLIGCNAGRWLPCAFLFNGIPVLKIIYGSPVPSDRTQAYFVTFAALYTLGVKRIDKSILSFSQLINFIITNGVIFRRERSQFEKDGLSEGVLWTVVEPFIEEIVKTIRGW